MEYSEITVQFINRISYDSNNKEVAKIGSNTYNFIVNTDCSLAIDSIFKIGERPVFKLITTDGYNYHDAEIVVLSKLPTKKSYLRCIGKLILTGSLDVKYISCGTFPNATWIPVKRQKPIVIYDEQKVLSRNAVAIKEASDSLDDFSEKINDINNTVITFKNNTEITFNN